MRIIKFRAWDVQMANMLDWDYLIYKQCTYLNSEHFHVMQFTGLYDINGKEIYEGDIIKHKYFSMKGVAEVCWNNEEACFLAIEPNGARILLRPNSEIIGNIFENPELISQN